MFIAGQKTVFPFLPYFSDGVSMGNFSDDANWQELSGMTAPYLDANSGWLWICSDSPANMIGGVSATNPATKFVLTLTAQTAMIDLEDITSARINGVNYLYGMDFGNNGNGVDSRGSGIDMRVFRIVEPTITGGAISTASFIEINCAFPAINGPTLRDAESSFVDPVDGKLYIIIKRDATQKVYSLAHAASYSGTQTLVYEGTMTALPESRTVALTTTPCFAVSACISKDGKEIMVKNYANVYHFPRIIGTDTVIQALQKTLNVMNYVGGGTLPTPKTSHPNAEPQGEGICFGFDDQNYYSNSEYVATEGSTAARYPLFRYDRISKAPTTATFQDGVSPTAGYAGTLDTYVWDTNGATAYGTELTFVVDTAVGIETDQRWGLLKFDISSIPNTARVVSVKLVLYINTEGAGWVFYPFSVAWDEASTYNGVTLAAINAAVASAEQGRNGVNLAGITGADHRTNLLTPLVQSWVNGTVTNNGWLVKCSDTGGNGVQFRSRTAVTASNRPQLIIKYV